MEGSEIGKITSLSSIARGSWGRLCFYAFLLNYDVCKRGTHNFKDVPKKTLCFPGRGGGEGIYEDVKGFCNSASIERVRKLDYVLTPGRYVGLPEDEDDFDFSERFTKLIAEFDTHVKSHFYMDLGIEGFRNCKLFK